MSQSNFAEERVTPMDSIVTDKPDKKIPIMEIFGPTIQGEGLMQGTLSHFIRTGGCPLRCEWCDTMYAVLPELVKENAERMTTPEILDAVCGLPYAPYVTLSGGDPCMHKTLGDLIPILNAQGRRVAVETQGTLFPSWLNQVDVITFSPKPPSSGNVVDPKPIFEWVHRARSKAQQVCIKVVVGDEEDFKYAMEVYKQFPPQYIDAFYFTALTRVPADHYQEHMFQGVVRAVSVIDSMQRLAETVLATAREGVKFHEKTHIGCQQHVLLWPDKDQGV